jgi:hypothetical protein
VDPRVRELVRRANDLECRAGRLFHMLHESQLEALAAIDRATARTFVLEIGRRWGKTYLMVALALMTAWRKPKTRVVYGAPTLKHLAEFVLPAFDKIAARVPADMRPRFNSANDHIECHNGSWVHLFGADNQRNADRGTGGDAELCIFDESGAEGVATMLKYIGKAIFGPSLQFKEGSPNGSIIYASTPARSPEHDFTDATEKAEATGNRFHATCFDNPRLTDAQRTAFIAADAADEGLSPDEYMKTDTFRREYLAERVVDPLLVVVPEWAEKRAKLLRAIDRPEFFRGMTTLDFGGSDPHGLHLGYWHPTLQVKDGKVGAYVLEYDSMLRGNTGVLNEEIRRLETQAYGVKKWEGTMAAARDAQLRALRDQVPKWMEGVMQAQVEGDEQPWMRVADNDVQLVRDLYELHGLAFIPTAKDDKQLQVNNLQVAIREERVFVHPRCEATDRHLRTTTWADHRRSTYSRRGGEHGEGVDCLVYALRNVDKRDPTPAEAKPRPNNLTVGSSIREELQRHEKARAASNVFLGGTPLGRKLMRRM